jgi:hypothetical protein
MARVSDDARQMLEGSYVYWMLGGKTVGFIHTHRIHGAAIYGNMDPINIPQMLAYNSIYTIHGSYGIGYPSSMIPLRPRMVIDHFPLKLPFGGMYCFHRFFAETPT